VSAVGADAKPEGTAKTIGFNAPVTPFDVTRNPVRVPLVRPLTTTDVTPDATEVIAALEA
jgi:hypothetical protein